MAAGVSIVLCTYNGAERLPETIGHIARQKVSEGILWEVIIVDNNSNDNSAEIANNEWNKYGCATSFIVKHQPKQGLTPAREMGFATALYDYILLCDDDNWLCENYVENAFHLMHQHPEIGILGGVGELVYEQEPPGWLWDFRILASGPQAWESGRVKRNLVYGAGAVIRKEGLELLKKSNFVFMLSDRNGNQLASGGDHELCYVFALAGYEIWYNEQLGFKHFITKDRLTWEYYQKYIQESSQCFPVLEAYKILLQIKTYSILFWAHLFRSLVYFIKNFIRFRLLKFSTPVNTNRYKILSMKCDVLQTRIFALLRFYTIRSNFRSALALKKRLQQTEQLNRNIPAKCPSQKLPSRLNQVLKMPL